MASMQREPIMVSRAEPPVGSRDRACLLLHMQQRPRRLPASPPSVCDIIGSLCALHFVICSTFVLLKSNDETWYDFDQSDMNVCSYETVGVIHYLTTL